MKYCTKDQNKNWFEAHNVRPEKIAIVQGEKNVCPFVNCNNVISQPSDNTLTYQMQSLVELIQLLCLEQECQQCFYWILLHLDHSVQLWILHLRDILTNTSKEGDRKVEWSGNCIIQNNQRDLGEGGNKQGNSFIRIRTQTNPEGLQQVELLPMNERSVEVRIKKPVTIISFPQNMGCFLEQ